MIPKGNGNDRPIVGFANQSCLWADSERCENWNSSTELVYGDGINCERFSGWRFSADGLSRVDAVGAWKTGRQQLEPEGGVHEMRLHNAQFASSGANLTVKLQIKCITI